MKTLPKRRKNSNDSKQAVLNEMPQSDQQLLKSPEQLLLTFNNLDSASINIKLIVSYLRELAALRSIAPELTHEQYLHYLQCGAKYDKLLKSWGLAAKPSQLVRAVEALEQLYLLKTLKNGDQLFCSQDLPFPEFFILNNSFTGKTAHSSLIALRNWSRQTGSL